jgi:hypothetical protein
MQTHASRHTNLTPNQGNKTQKKDSQSSQFSPRSHEWYDEKDNKNGAPLGAPSHTPQ